MEKLILAGFGGHAESVADSVERAGRYRIIGYTDTEKRRTKYPYLGTDTVLYDYRRKGIENVCVTVGYMGKGDLREHLYRQLKEWEFHFPVIVDPSAVVSASARIGEGTFVGKTAVVNAGAEVGKLCILNTKAVIEHDCVVGDFTHVAVSAVLCGGVHIGNRSFIGANATVIQGIYMPEEAFVPAGEIIRRNTEMMKCKSILRSGGVIELFSSCTCRSGKEALRHKGYAV